MTFLDFMLNLDIHLNELIQNYGIWTYAALFFIIFCETGLVVIPFLPGDSLIFAAGTFAALGSLNPILLFALLALAAILGDTLNYSIGRSIGSKLCANSQFKLIKKEHLDKTKRFYEKHGGKTIILARFVPIIRTFAPFVAGIGEMNYLHFIIYNVIGGVLWVGIFTSLGFFFGNLPLVKNNFSIVIFAIVILSALPGVIGVMNEKRKPETVNS